MVSAIVYVIVGLVIAVAGGTIIEKLHMENHVEEFIRRAKGGVDIEAPDLTVKKWTLTGGAMGSRTSPARRTADVQRTRQEDHTLVRR